MKFNTTDITTFDDFRIGNADSRAMGTGCTVIICEKGATGGVDVRGGAPATTGADLLRYENTVGSVNAVVISGGSVFGLEAASGVTRELSERGIGAGSRDHAVPIVCGASLYDLEVGDNKAFPDIEMGRDAVRNAFSERSFSNGNSGAGAGCSVGKSKGMDRAMKTGLGTFACSDGELEVGAVAAVNAYGDVYNGAGNIIAGMRSEDGRRISGTIRAFKSMVRNIPYRPASDDRTVPDTGETAGAQIRSGHRDKMTETAKTQIRSENKEKTAETAEAQSRYRHKEKMTEIAEAIREELRRTSEIKKSDITEKLREITAERESMSQETAAADIAGRASAHEKAEQNPYGRHMRHAETETGSASAPAEPASSAGPAAAENKESAPPKPVNHSAEQPKPVYRPAEQPKPVYRPAEQPAKEQPAEQKEPSRMDEFVPDQDDLGYDIPFNTTIGCLVTNARLTRSQANKLASILQDAYARAIKPVHSTQDGDTIFVLASGRYEVSFDAFAALATDVMQYAIIDGALSAKPAYGLPSAGELQDRR